MYKNYFFIKLRTIVLNTIKSCGMKSKISQNVKLENLDCFPNWDPPIPPLILLPPAPGAPYRYPIFACDSFAIILSKALSRTFPISTSPIGGFYRMKCDSFVPVLLPALAFFFIVFTNSFFASSSSRRQYRVVTLLGLASPYIV